MGSIPTNSSLAIIHGFRYRFRLREGCIKLCNKCTNNHQRSMRIRFQREYGRYPYDVIASIKLEKGLLPSIIRLEAPALVSSKSLELLME